MLYAVGTHIDLRHLSDRQLAEAQPARAEKQARLFPPGTNFSFIKMAQGLIVTKITEPTIALRVTVSA